MPLNLFNVKIQDAIITFLEGSMILQLSFKIPTGIQSLMLYRHKVLTNYVHLSRLYKMQMIS